MSGMDWLKLGFVSYMACFAVVIMAMHRKSLLGGIHMLWVRRTAGISILALAPLSLVAGILILVWFAMCAIGREIEDYARFGRTPADEQ